MKKLLIIGPILLGTVFLAGCGMQQSVSDNHQNTTPINTNPIAETRIVTNVSGATIKTLTIGNEDSFTLPIGNKQSSTTFKLKLMSGEIIMINVAPVQPTTGVSLRLNQIIDPANAADGPYSMDNNVAISSSGEYTFIVGEDLMAAEVKFVGDVKITVKISK